MHIKFRRLVPKCKKNIKISKKFTRQFEANFSNTADEDDNNTSQEELEENENDLQTSPATPKHIRKPINEDKLPPSPPQKNARIKTNKNATQ